MQVTGAPQRDDTQGYLQGGLLYSVVGHTDMQRSFVTIPEKMLGKTEGDVMLDEDSLGWS